MRCIICDLENDSKSIEHIVPESMGNTFYTLSKGKVCDVCNNRFSKFEKKALSNSIFLPERAIGGVRTKKGKIAKGKINELSFEGDGHFRKGYLTVKGLNKENTSNYNPSKNTVELTVPLFDKSPIPLSRLLLSIGIESIYESQKELFNKHSFQHLKDYLTIRTNNDWPFVTSKVVVENFLSIPKYNSKYQLSKINCELKYFELNEDTLLFKFIYGGITMVINLLNRNLEWTKDYMLKDRITNLYPEHYRKKRLKPYF